MLKKYSNIQLDGRNGNHNTFWYVVLFLIIILQYLKGKKALENIDCGKDVGGSDVEDDPFKEMPSTNHSNGSCGSC